MTRQTTAEYVGVGGQRDGTFHSRIVYFIVVRIQELKHSFCYIRLTCHLISAGS
jgi:hypothetical protein